MNRRGFFAGTIGLLFGKLFGKSRLGRGPVGEIMDGKTMEYGYTSWDPSGNITYTHTFLVGKLTDKEVAALEAQWIRSTGKLEFVPILETNRAFNLVLEANSKPKRI